jgi:Protein of unknown function (DUF669)
MPDVLSFDATTVAPAAPRDVLPAAWYRAWIIDSELKPTKAGDGEYLQLVWEILDGDHAARRVWDRLNVKNPNETAQKIAQEALSAICHAVGVLRIANTGQLHGKPCLIRVTVKKQAGYEDQNEIKGYMEDGGTAKPATAPKAAATPLGRPAALADAADDLPF